MVGRTELVRRFDACVSAELEQYGFVREHDLSYVKTEGQWEKRIGIAVVQRSEVLRIQVGVRVRSGALQEIYDLGSPRPGFGSFGGLLHVIAQAPSKDFDILLHEDQIGKAVDRCIAGLRSVGFGFLDQYADYDRMRRSLESENSNDWFSLDAQGRVKLLSALLWVTGNQDDAFAVLTRFLESAQSASLPSKRWQRASDQFQYLLRRRGRKHPPQV